MKAKFLALAALVLGMVSCQNDFDGANVGNKGEVDLTLSVAVPEMETRAAGNTSDEGGLTNINLEKDYDIRYILEVYDANGALAKERMYSFEDTADNTTFNLRLVPGRGYSFVVWADFVPQVDERDAAESYDYHYNTSAGLTKVMVVKDHWTAINESRDAYTGKHFEADFRSSSSILVTLTRPFAKLRVVTTDIKELYGDLMPETVKVNYLNTYFYNEFNALTQDVEGQPEATDEKVVDLKTMTYEYEDPKGTGVMTLFADYFFRATDDRVMFTMDVQDNTKQDIPTIVFNTNIPVKRNYLTTVMGPVLTDANSISVTIEEGFANGKEWNPEDDKYDVEAWDGETLNAPVDSNNDGIYEIGTGAQLAYLAAAVNGTLPSTASTRAGEVDWAKEEFVLTANIDLDNNNWTPIGITEAKSFRGAFDGQGKTIYNLRIDSKSRAGLFGYVGRDSGSNDGNVYGAIRNLKLHNVNMKTSSGAALCGNLFRGEISDIELTGKVTIEGTAQNVAGVVGYHYGNLANITVDVTEDSYVKSATGYCGGVASYSGEGDYTKTNIESNIKVIASGEAVGGLFALLQYGNSATDCSCSATVINDCAVDSHNRYVRTGGIAGCWVENASAKTTLTGCEFTGTVKATRQDGLTASKLAHGGLVGASYNTAGYGELNIDGKKYVDVYKSAGLANAVKLEGYTIYMTAGPWGDGVNITEYTMPTSIADNVTIEGVKEAILNMNNISEIGGADNLTIDGITVNWNGNTYSGFTHSTGHVYKNITFNGAFFCWNQSARFEDCVFNLNANQYIWTYGCNVDFERCTFNCVDGKGILIYNEGTDVTVNINNCEFSSSKHAQTGNGQNIAAIEISNAVNNPKFTVSINNCVSKGGFAYDDFICRFKDEVTAENLANLNVTVDGLKYVSEGVIEDAEGNLVVNSLQTLETALKSAGAAGAGDTNIVFAENSTLDMTNVEWTPIKVDGYHGADIVTIEGNGAVITGLTAPLFAGGFAGGSGIVIKDLTIKDSDIVSANTLGSGAFIESVDSMDKITLTNCHLLNSTVTGGAGSRTGGLIGWTAGYNNVNDGPVKTYVTIDNCSVVGCTIQCDGSVGGINGHAGNNAWTYTTISNCTIQNNKLISTDDGEWRTGVVVGTANVGEVTISNITESGNTLTQTGKTAPEGFKRNYYGRFVPGTTGKLTIDGEEVVMINTAEKLTEAIENAKAGDTITIDGDITLTENVTIPAGVTFNGNGKQINGTLVAGGDIAFAGHTKVTAFSAGYSGYEITIGEGACLEITGGGRSTMGYNNTFNITGTITDAKSADKANIQPSLIMPAGISITGGNGLELNIKDAYVQIGSTTSKNSAANGTFTINIENSIAEFTNQLTFSEPTNGMNPTFNLNVKNSVLTTATKLILTAPNCNMVVDNSTIDVKTYFRNSGNVELKNGSVLTGNTIQFGENGGHDGTTTVDASKFTIKASSTGHAYDGRGTGSITLKNGAEVNVDYYKALTINSDATSSFTGTEVL